MQHLIIFVLILGLIPCVNAQQNYLSGTLTQINLNFSLPKNLKLNSKLESRQIFREKETGKPRITGFNYERTDLHVILTKKLSADNTIGGGYLVRLEDGDFTHRLIQQFNHVRKLELASLAHRLVLDETFSKDEPVQIRLRYRLSVEKALNGRSVDPREFYLKLNNEYLGIIGTGKPDLEIRASAALGYNVSDDNKIELGLEYRVNEFYTAAKAQQLWVTIAWYLGV